MVPIVQSLIISAPYFFWHLTRLFTIIRPQKKVVHGEIVYFYLSFPRLDKVFVCRPSRPIWDEFPQSPVDVVLN